MQGLNERENAVLDLIMNEGTTSVRDLSNALNVSNATIRNTLNRLSQKGAVFRTRGGVTPSFHPAIAARQKSRLDEKERIARKAAELIEDGTSAMINAGTTTSLIARYLLGKQDISLVTNSSLVIPYCRTNPQLQLTTIGGEFRPSAESFVGPSAIEFLRRFQVDVAFLGTDGFSLETGLTNQLVDGAEIVRTMAAQADRVVVVADSSKWNNRGFVQALELTEVDCIVTDSDLSTDAKTALREFGIELILA